MEMSNAAAKGMMEKVGNYQTHYHEAGEGENVLLIHGAGLGVSAWANWRLLFPLLSQKNHVFAFDLVGYGSSEKPEDMNYSKEVWIEHIIDFIEEKMKPPVCVVGNSMGGILSLHIANRRPDLIKKQILLGVPGVHFEITEALDFAWGAEPSFENVRRIVSYFAYDQSFAQNDDLVKIRYESSNAEGVYATFSSMFPAPRQRHIDDLVLTDKELQTIQTPTLLIHGREDKLVPAETSWKMATSLPNADFHLLSNCGHWIQIEKSSEFANLVTNFLE